MTLSDELALSLHIHCNMEAAFVAALSVTIALNLILN